MMIELILQLLMLDMFSEVTQVDFAECLNQKFIGNDFIDLGFIVSVENSVFLVCVDPGR
jgi:hypothetical protein